MKIDFYTGKAWKHHIASDFQNGMPTSGGAGKGGTIFLDYYKMLDYLKKDGRDWYIAELDLKDNLVKYEYGNDYMVTTLVNIISKKGFKPINLNKKIIKENLNG
jgi:hypothetical protein